MLIVLQDKHNQQTPQVFMQLLLPESQVRMQQMLATLCSSSNSGQLGCWQHGDAARTAGRSKSGNIKSHNATGTMAAAAAATEQDHGGREGLPSAAALQATATAGQPLGEGVEEGPCSTVGQEVQHEQQARVSAEVHLVLPTGSAPGSPTPHLTPGLQKQAGTAAAYRNNSSSGKSRTTDGAAAYIWSSTAAGLHQSKSWCRRVIRDLWHSGTKTGVRMLDSGSGASASSFWMTFKEDVSVVCVLEVKHALMGMSCLGCRGAFTLVSNLVRSLDAGSLTEKEVRESQRQRHCCSMHAATEPTFKALGESTPLHVGASKWYR